jgi:hypothetical protein
MGSIFLLILLVLVRIAAMAVAYFRAMRLARRGGDAKFSNLYYTFLTLPVPLVNAFHYLDRALRLTSVPLVVVERNLIPVCKPL